MKKIFNNRNEPNEVINTANFTIGQNYSHFIGRTFQLEKHIVTVDDVIAEGGFSIVFLVKSNHNGKKYALKRMYVNNEADLEACKRELKINKSLSERSNKILKYVDSSIARQTDEIYEILLLTKYCKLGGLVQLINDRLAVNPNTQLQENEIIKMFCDICEGVAELHDNGIIHRDLKIENILIDNSDPDKKNKSNAMNPNFINYVLCDFGSATTKTFDRRLTSSAQQVQLVADEIQKYTTLAYRSPEMVDLYSNKLITTKSDIWALGCLLYKICYFQMPFGESQLAIQEGRYTVPDAKANFFSKKLNSLINYMLDPDPAKRPDIFQVAYLAFTLAQRPCPIKNTHNSPLPTFDSLTPPLTETEQRNLAAQIQLKKQQANLNATSTDTTTTVNPRERPKGNINLKSAQSTPNKINLAKKPPPTVVIPQQPSIPQIAGFDDDFSSIPPPLNNPSITPVNTNTLHLPTTAHSLMPTSSSTDFIDNQQLHPARKSHRRSASHSSSIFQPSSSSPAVINSYPNGNLNNTNNTNNPSFNSETQQAQYQQYLQQQQWFIQAKLQQQQQIQQMANLAPTPQISALIANHSRSASASPNVAAKLGMLTLQKSPPVPVSPPTVYKQQQPVPNNIINQNPFNTQQTSTGNPFGDNFSNMNDNDLFGLEFDRIRQNTNPENNQGDLLRLSENNQGSGKTRSSAGYEQYQQSGQTTFPKPATKANHNYSSRSSSSRSSSTNEYHQNRDVSNSSKSSSHSSTYNRSASSTNFDSEKKYSSASTIISVGSSVFSKSEKKINSATKSSGKHNKSAQSKSSKTKPKSSDPFRQAPFRIQTTSIPKNHSSSDSSSSSLTQPVMSTVMASQEQKPASGSLQNLSNPDSQNLVSAFQPYKRQADPFAGAPFDHVHKRVSPESTHQRYDRRRSKEKKSNANREVFQNLNVVDLDEDDSKNEEIIEVISKGKNSFQTPDSLNKSVSKVNPFINAPFTVTKKSLKASALPKFEFYTNVDGSEESVKPSISVKPVIPVKPSLNSIIKSPEIIALTSRPEIANKPVLTSPNNLTRNLNSEINELSANNNNVNSKNKPSILVKPILTPSSSMPYKMNQSQSLNEIKNQTFQPQQIQRGSGSRTYEESRTQEALAQPVTSFEPVIDTSKLHFKKKTLTITGDKLFKKNSSAAGGSATKPQLTKSHSQNENISHLPQRNLVSHDPAANSSKTGDSGGISNMSFDDF